MKPVPRVRPNLKILFLTRYGFDGASSRYRTLQFLPWLRNHGVDCTVQSFFGQGYVSKRFGGTTGFLAMLPAAYWRRIRRMVSSGAFDLISVEKEVFPYLPGGIESGIFLKNARYTVDYDDAVYHRYDQHSNCFLRTMLADKISRVMAGAKAVTAGSRYILDYARQYNPNSFLVPTVIDLSLYPDAEPPMIAAHPFLIGWIGSQATTQYLKSVEDALGEFCSTRNARVLVIGGNPIPLRVPSVEWVPWSRENEVKWLSAIHVGIMPLKRNPWSMGKCAFKLIQYMACWKPVVASPVGENNRVVSHGLNGYLADTKEEWIEALNDLYRDSGRCREMGRAGRRMVEERYHLDAVAPLVLDILYSASGSRDRS